jgi:hypothetical protein
MRLLLAPLLCLLALPLCAITMEDLEGTWTQTSREDGTIQEKTFLSGEWSVIQRDPYTRNLKAWLGGTYRIEDGKLVEQCLFASTEVAHVRDTESVFTMSLKGNRLTQTWPDSDYAEHYWRNSSFTPLPTLNVATTQVGTFHGTWLHKPQEEKHLDSHAKHTQRSIDPTSACRSGRSRHQAPGRPDAPVASLSAGRASHPGLTRWRDPGPLRE